MRVSSISFGEVACSKIHKNKLVRTYDDGDDDDDRDDDDGL